MNSVDTLYKFLVQNAPVMLITGAGCSTDSGIPDYRDKTGGWKRPRPIHLSDFLSSKRAKQNYWSRSMTGWPYFEAAKPNNVHAIITQLEKQGLISVIVTQNVDDLHQQAGSKDVIPLHGSLSTVTCNECNKTYCRSSLQDRLCRENPEFVGLEVDPGPDGDSDLVGPNISSFEIPFCESCGGTLQPDVVFYGGAVPKARVQLVHHGLDRSKAVLIIGSSVMVFSSYRICRTAHEQGKPLAALNQGVTRADHLLEFRVQKNAAQVLSAIHERINTTL